MSFVIVLSFMIARCGGLTSCLARPDTSPGAAVDIDLSHSAALWGNARGQAAQIAGPTAVLDQFMRAVADSNLSRMAELWGTRSGPVAETRIPADYERRLQIMQAHLKGNQARVLAAIDSADDRIAYRVELKLGDCRRHVRFEVVRIREGRWIVNRIDLGALLRPCATEERLPPTI